MQRKERDESLLHASLWSYFVYCLDTARSMVKFGADVAASNGDGITNAFHSLIANELWENNKAFDTEAVWLRTICMMSSQGCMWNILARQRRKSIFSLHEPTVYSALRKSNCFFLFMWVCVFYRRGDTLIDYLESFAYIYEEQACELEDRRGLEELWFLALKFVAFLEHFL